MSQIRQKGFAKRLEERLLQSHNTKLHELESEDLLDLFALFWDELTVCLREGHRVIFDGWMSFFTNPVKKKCYDVQPAGSSKSETRRALKWSFKHRVRFRPLASFRQQAETELSEEEYTALKAVADALAEERKLKNSKTR